MSEIQTQEVSLTTEYIRLDQLLKFVGFCSTGGQAKELVALGCCVVNSEPCLQRGKKIRGGDKVFFTAPGGKTVCLKVTAEQ